ncbi:PTS system mannose/fructose/N-acetylgalactosamine-transporter subunit IIB [Abyssisolibacter fermentans]|uniref:PTS system mannose/fructose/N-acetylgalactosamine-transporter subunit IIB n=1 Tax=Abyssisolibacter fermentans TaxID=1766203 RepID=UPI00082DA810|nr:PTS sugar transporter subunit IIB [Abyssisolibacter fermentans]
MKINLIRIDERLIHGQIVTTWIENAHASKIIVADDKAAADEFQQSLLKMTTPSGVQLEILSLEDTVNKIKNDESDVNVLMIAKSPESILRLLDLGFEFSKVNVGNIGMKKGKKSLLPYIWVDENDVKALKTLLDRGIELEARSIPTDKSQKVSSLLEKY